MIVIGIDPGLSGGMVALEENEIDLKVTPTVSVGKKNDYDERQMIDWLTPYAIKQAKVFIELVHAMPGQGVTSMFTFGSGFGLIRGICAGLGMSYQLVRPQEWQKRMLLGNPKGSEYLVASRIWPNTDWRASPRCRVAHSGLVDAALIAEYGRRIA